LQTWKEAEQAYDNVLKNFDLVKVFLLAISMGAINHNPFGKTSFTDATVTGTQYI